MGFKFIPTTTIPKSGEIRLGYVNADNGNHKYTGIRPYLIVSNNVYNNTSNHAEVIPFTTRRFDSKNPVHIQFPKGEVKGLNENSTLIIEGRTTLPHNQLTEPIGYFNSDNWKKAATGLLYQNPHIKYAFDEGVHNTLFFNHLLTAK